jgi:hypothetical protein
MVAHFLMKGNKNCEFYIIDANYHEHYTFPAQKNSKVREILSRGMTRFSEYGLTDGILLKYIDVNRIQNCQNYLATDEMKFQNILPIFYFLGI